MELCGVNAVHSLHNMCLWLVLVLLLRLGHFVFHEAEVLLNLIAILLCTLDNNLKLRLLDLLVGRFLIHLFISQPSHLLVALLHDYQQSLGLLRVHHKVTNQLSVVTAGLRG